MKKIYMDYYGNPSATHWAGKWAKEAVEITRKQVAGLLVCDPNEVIFTSGGSESNNHALKGVYYWPPYHYHSD